MEHFLDHILSNKTSLNKFKKFEIMSSIFFDHNGMKLEINHKKKKKTQNTQNHGDGMACY